MTPFPTGMVKQTVVLVAPFLDGLGETTCYADGTVPDGSGEKTVVLMVLFLMNHKALSVVR